MPRKSSLIYWTLVLTIIFAGLHFAALYFYLYWIYWWFDWMMHFLAGLVGGLATYWVLFDSGLWRRQSDKILLPMLSVVICLLIVGVAWEAFEYTFGITDSHEPVYVNDVIHDLIMDTLGALLAVFIGVKQTLLRHSSTQLTIND